DVTTHAVGLDHDVVEILDALHAAPLCPARRHVGRIGVGPQLRVTVHVLAHEAGGVAGVLQPGADTSAVAEVVGAAVVAAVFVYAGAMRVLTREDARPARGAQRRGHKRLGERNTLIG